MRGKSKGAVPRKDLHVLITQRAILTGSLGERRVTFDRERLRSQFRQQRGNVAGTAAYFENNILGVSCSASSMTATTYGWEMV